MADEYKEKRSFKNLFEYVITMLMSAQAFVRLIIFEMLSKASMPAKTN